MVYEQNTGWSSAVECESREMAGPLEFWGKPFAPFLLSFLLWVFRRAQNSRNPLFARVGAGEGNRTLNPIVKCLKHIANKGF